MLSWVALRAIVMIVGSIARSIPAAIVLPAPNTKRIGLSSLIVENEALRKSMRKGERLKVDHPERRTRRLPFPANPWESSCGRLHVQ